MQTLRARIALLLTLGAIGVLSPPYAARGSRAFEALPRLTLWAWERPVDLRGLRDDVAVAFLAQTITLTDGRMHLVSRRHALKVSDETPLVAVTRIEAPAGQAGAITAGQVDNIARVIAQTAGLPRVAAVQVDFDAASSQRAAYRDLLTRLRALLDGDVPLSMTALASWCLDDNWLEGLPVDEAVVMLFRMGPDARYARRAANRSALAPVCRDATGTSLDEPIELPRGRQRLYVFSSAPWSSAAIAAARELQ